MDYRLAENCGCDTKRDAQVEYRLAAARDLRWIGSGLAELGLVAGESVDADVARALMDGKDWRTGEQLVRRKKVLDPRGKVPANVVVDAISQAAETDGMTPAEYLGNTRLAARLARAERGIKREGERHATPVADAERLAAAAGLSAKSLYGAKVIAEATKWKGRHVDVGLRGVDVTVEMPKSLSVAFGLADAATAEALEDEWVASVNEAVTDALEPWAAYGMAGHHGDGERAQRVESSGLLGWTTLHRSARPVDASPGDPHLHIHINVAHMVKCADGKWRTPGAGAEDFHRYARLVNEIAEARFRARLIERHGARFERSEKGAWELVGIGEDLRTAFSRRHQQIVELVGTDATREQQKTAARRSAEAKEETGPEAPRLSWRERAAAVLAPPVDPRLYGAQRDAAVLAARQAGEAAVDAMVTAALPGPDDGPALSLAAGGGPLMPSPAEIAATIWDAEHGLTASKKTVSHTHVMAAVAAAVPYLLSVEQLAELTDAVLAVDGHAVRLPDSNRHHHTHRQRYTHHAVVEAEQTIIECATEGLDAGLAQLTEAAAELAVSTSEAAQGFDFSAEQRAVVMRLLTAGHGADAVIGVAGAGKTTLMNAARTGWEAAGLRVVGASTAAVAAANLAAEAGIESQTIAAWTREISGGQGLHGVGAFVIDEAAMVDDRALAVLLRHAATTGTKVAGVGDPQQLRAVGIGGGFARIHRIVGGLELTENRRQRDPVERTALQTWRDGARTSALSQLAEHGHVHAGETATEAMTAMLDAWNTARERWTGDPHGQVEGLLLLAARRTDVATLNAAARARLVAAGELEQGRTYTVDGGGRVSFATGDLVHIRRNDYRSRRNESEPDVLNGFRGVVRDVRADQGVLVEWRRPNPHGGHTVQQAWMSARDIAEGRLTHGYAITIGSAQGLTADVAIAYGLHADAHSLYPALSRARQESHLFLPLRDLEDDVTRIRLGTPRTDAECLDRAVAAYGKLLERDGDDVMVTDELATTPVPQPRQSADEAPRADAVNDAATVHDVARDAVDAEAREAVRLAAEAFPHPAKPTSEQRVATPIDALREHYRDNPPDLTPDQRDRLQHLLDVGYASRPEPTPEPEARPEVPHWSERPYGRLTTEGLRSKLADATAQARRADRLAIDHDLKARALERELTTHPSPGRRAANEATALLDRADALLRTAQAEAHAEQAANATAKEARAVAEQAEQQAQRGRLALRLAGTSRAEQQDLALQHRGRMAAAYTEEQRARSAGHDAATAAWETIHGWERAALFREQGATGYPPRTLDQLGERLTAMRQHLPALAQQIDAARTERADGHRSQAAVSREQAAGFRATASAVQAEKDLRTTMASHSPQQHAAEVTERETALQDARARQAERAAHVRQAAEASAQAHRYQPPSQGRGGPSLGR
ncbi:MobF family relaxase [Streptomyces sp. XH2]|uniref:MobF family relaxase n=1 Tax=Streptomyces sp. XH2 TaxID=3412483 RepID=UPI003C7C64D1